MLPLERNQLVHLTPAAWQPVHDRAWDAQALEILTHWRAHQWPLVVTRLRIEIGDTEICLGLPAPRLWSRRKLALVMPPSAIASVAPFPTLGQLTAANHWGAPTLALDVALQQVDVQARVYGSYAWQHITGLDYVHPDSDIDLILPVRDIAHACQALAPLAQSQLPQRLDGEFVFTGGLAVAWRELQQLINGQVTQVLVKHRTQVGLMSRQALEASYAGLA
jgi:phosphoribosyl-dephospho-CoA transferase